MAQTKQTTFGCVFCPTWVRNKTDLFIQILHSCNTYMSFKCITEPEPGNQNAWRTHIAWLPAIQGEICAHTRTCCNCILMVGQPGYKSLKEEEGDRSYITKGLHSGIMIIRAIIYQNDVFSHPLGSWQSFGKKCFVPHCLARIAS